MVTTLQDSSFYKGGFMPQYTDTVLKKFPFVPFTQQSRLNEDISPIRNMFGFNYYESDDDLNPNNFQWEDPEEIARIISQELRKSRRPRKCRAKS
jgi:hypothetical protein